MGKRTLQGFKMIVAENNENLGNIIKECETVKY